MPGVSAEIAGLDPTMFVVSVTEATVQEVKSGQAQTTDADECFVCAA